MFERLRFVKLSLQLQSSSSRRQNRQRSNPPRLDTSSLQISRVVSWVVQRGPLLPWYRISFSLRHTHTMQKPPSTPRHLSLPPLLVWYPPMLRYSRHRPWFRIPMRLPDRGERGQTSWTSVRAVDLSFFLVAGLHDLPVRSVATSQLLAILFASKVEYSHLTHTERCSQGPFSFHLDTTSSRENNTLVLRYPRSRGVFLFHNGMQAAGIA